MPTPGGQDDSNGKQFRGPTSGGGGGYRNRPSVDIQRLFDRLPPHSLEAEMALLGSMILDHRVISEVIAIVPTSAYFYRESHATIYDALVRTYDSHQSGDLVQLMEVLKEKRQLDDVGGTDYLVRLAESVPSAVSAPHYAKIVRERAQLRQLAEAAGQILYDAFHSSELGGDSSDATRTALDRAEQMIFEIADKAVGADADSLSILLQQALDMLLQNEGRSITGLDTGFYELSEMTSGLQPGEMIIVAGRPSMGKTAFALNLAEQIALGGQPHAEHGPETAVGIFSMEMSRQALVQRLLCAHAGVDSHRFRTNRLSKEDFIDLRNSCGILSRAPIYIDDTPGLTILMLRAKARRMVAQHGVKCIMIDYLQLMGAPTASKDGRQSEVGAISRGVKALARELSVPIVCLSQLNRGPEDRTGNRPRMSDLRESGSIEQDADVVMLLHREEYYHLSEPGWAEENPDKVGVAEVIIAKQRNGPTGTVELTWDGKTTRFRNPSGAHRADSFIEPAPKRPPPAPGLAPGGFGGPAGSFSSDRPPVVPFSPGSRSGPVGEFRDGGGPSRDVPPAYDDEGDEGPAPF